MIRLQQSLKTPFAAGIRASRLLFERLWEELLPPVIVKVQVPSEY